MTRALVAAATLSLLLVPTIAAQQAPGEAAPQIPPVQEQSADEEDHNARAGHLVQQTLQDPTYPVYYALDRIAKLLPFAEDGTPIDHIVGMLLPLGEEQRTALQVRDAVFDGTLPAETGSTGPAKWTGVRPEASDSDAGASNPTAQTQDSGAVMMRYAVVLAGGLGLVLTPLSMYRRVKKSKALDNDVRRSIYRFIENNPGATVTEIAEGVGVSHSTATYHVKILTEFDLISKRRDGNSLHIFPSDAGLGRKEALLLSYMRERETREIIRSVYANPWTYPSELARQLNMSRSSAQWHLEKLEDCGIVQVARDGKFSYLYIDPDMKDTVEDHLVQ